MAVFDAAATIRQLLIDQRPLVDAVNRQWRLPILFEVNNLPKHLFQDLEDGHCIVYIGPGLSPEGNFTEAGTSLVKRDQFFKQPVLITAWKQVTVREFVLFVAQKAGGVHFDETPDETTSTLNALMRGVDSDDFPVFVGTMRSIAQITVRALQPLCHRDL